MFKNLKHQKSRRDQFADSSIPSSISQSKMNNGNQESLLLQEEQINIDLEPHSSGNLPLQCQNQMKYDETVKIYFYIL